MSALLSALQAQAGPRASTSQGFHSGGKVRPESSQDLSLPALGTRPATSLGFNDALVKQNSLPDVSSFLPNAFGPIFAAPSLEEHRVLRGVISELRQRSSETHSTLNARTARQRQLKEELERVRDAVNGGGRLNMDDEERELTERVTGAELGREESLIAGRTMVRMLRRLEEEKRNARLAHEACLIERRDAEEQAEELQLGLAEAVNAKMEMESALASLLQEHADNRAERARELAFLKTVLDAQRAGEKQKEQRVVSQKKIEFDVNNQALKSLGRQRKQQKKTSVVLSMLSAVDKNENLDGTTAKYVHAMEKIRMRTGVAEPEEILVKFVDREANMEKLETEKEENIRRVHDLGLERFKCSAQKQEIEFSGLSLGYSRDVLEKVEKKIRFADRTEKAIVMKYESVAPLLTSLRLGLAGLFDRVGQSLPVTPPPPENYAFPEDPEPSVATVVSSAPKEETSVAQSSKSQGGAAPSKEASKARTLESEETEKPREMCAEAVAAKEAELRLFQTTMSRLAAIDDALTKAMKAANIPQGEDLAMPTNGSILSGLAAQARSASAKPKPIAGPGATPVPMPAELNQTSRFNLRVQSRADAERWETEEPILAEDIEGGVGDEHRTAKSQAETRLRKARAHKKGSHGGGHQ